MRDNLIKALEYLATCEIKIMAPEHSIMDFANLLADFADHLNNQPKEHSYLLFGKAACKALEDGTIDDVIDLIREGEGYATIKDSVSSATILELSENYGAYCFISLEDYEAILNYDLDPPDSRDDKGATMAG